MENLNSTVTNTLTIHNTGTSAVNVTKISYPIAFSGDWDGGIITAGGLQNVTVTFNPTNFLDYSGTIQVLDTAGRIATANVTGAGFNTFSYTDTGTEITLTGLNSWINHDIIIPSSIDGKPVTSIGDYAFGNNPLFAYFPDLFLTSVKIPPTVTSIGNRAFFGCGKLSVAEFLGNAPTMGNQVFDSTDSEFIVKCYGQYTGFTLPTWNNYPVVKVDPLVFLSGNLAFGTSEVNSTVTTTITILNSGTSATNVTGISYPTGFSGDWNGGSIPAGSSQNVMVTFNPSADQFYGGVIHVLGMTGWSTSAIISGTG